MSFYHGEQRALQQHFQTERMANLLEEVIVHREVQEAERAFIESRATPDARHGRVVRSPWRSTRGSCTPVRAEPRASRAAGHGPAALARPLVRVPAEPGLDVGAGSHHPGSPLPGVRERGAHEDIAHAFATAGRRHFRMLKVDDVVGELAVEQLGLALGQIHHEPGARGLVAHGGALGVSHGRNLRGA